jgi:hypothetical protein
MAAWSSAISPFRDDLGIKTPILEYCADTDEVNDNNPAAMLSVLKIRYSFTEYLVRAAQPSIPVIFNAIKSSG